MLEERCFLISKMPHLLVLSCHHPKTGLRHNHNKIRSCYTWKYEGETAYDQKNVQEYQSTLYSTLF